MKYSAKLLSYLSKKNIRYETHREDFVSKIFEIEHGDVIRKIPEDVVIWLVTSCEKHPDADKLFVCQVNCGQKGNYQIITWWENIWPDMYVPVALPGCYLPVIDLEIWSRKMRWLDSAGMICSKWELGILEDEDQHWIWDMDNDLHCNPEMIGKPLGQVFPFLEDRVFEVENVAITNRPDMTWHIGLVYEAWAIWWRDYTSSTNTSYNNLPNSATQVISSTDKLLDYTMFDIKWVDIKRSNFPNRLQLIDLSHTTFYNRVDFSNLFMEITGQPIHIFDADKIVWNIHIKEIQESQEFLDLTGEKHVLESWDIVICDDQKILALWGIIWWQSSMVLDTTKNIIIEIANFNSTQIRKTAKRLWLRTDAVVRFEKGIPVWWTRKCIDILYFMLRDQSLMDLGDIEIVWRNNHQPITLTEWSILLDIKKLEKFVYWDVVDNNKSVYLDILHSLWYKTSPFNQFEDDEYKVYPPVHRADISNIQDIYEDITRHIGFENIPDIRLPSLSKDLHVDKVFVYQKEISNKMIIWSRADQVETYPWYSESTINLFGFDISKHFALTNPTSAPEPYLRHYLFPNLLKLISENYRITTPINIFEFGDVFIKWEDRYQEDRVENNHFCHIYADTPSKERSSDRFLIQKSDIQDILSKITDEVIFQKSDYPYLHPKKQYDIYIWSTKVWHGGIVHPIVCEDMSIDPALEVGMVEVDLTVLHDSQHKSDEFVDYRTNQDQILYRDLSFEVDTNQDFGKIKEAVLSVDSIADMEVFDIFRIDADSKSIGIKIKIIWDGTLKLEDINEIMKQTISAVEQTWARLRWQVSSDDQSEE